MGAPFWAMTSVGNDWMELRRAFWLSQLVVHSRLCTIRWLLRGVKPRNTDDLLDMTLPVLSDGALRFP